MRVENFIALRFIKEIRKNKEISSASFIVITVIVISMIFFISASSIMNGYLYGLMKIAFEVKTFHAIFPAYYSLNDSRYAVDIVKKDKRVLYANLYRETKALLSANGKTTGLAFFRTMPENIFEEDRGFDSCIKMLEGVKSLNINEIMISRKTAEKLRLKTGERIYLTTMLSDDKEDIVIKRLLVSGIFTTGYVEFDEQLAMIGNNTGDKVFADNLLYNVFIKLKDYKKAKEFSKSFTQAGMLDMMTWYDLNEYELKALKFEKNIIVFIVILVVFVACLNILTTINITVFEKNKNIGILKALGYSQNSIITIFIFYGIYLGICGVLIGIILGLLIMNLLNEILAFFSYIINFYNSVIYFIVSKFIDVSAPDRFEFFSKDFYLDKIYANISFSELFFISVLTLFFSLISSILPALKAGKVKPIEVIKNG
ncbi:MAG: ABC transporter permease [Spirochaetes bacterium]|nr:ABC transporter permease [Spirochaetota bacterium]